MLPFTDRVYGISNSFSNASAFIYDKEIKSKIHIPLVADIHFDYKIALAAAEAGVDKIRINPGNIGDKDKIRQVAEACKARGIPIRIGVNSGSLEMHILKKYGSPTAEALAESALYHASLLREWDFEDIIISVKSSDPMTMIRANRILAERTDYPLHLGVTEAGARERAIIKSSIGVGALLSEGIGDTLRVSLTDDPVAEVRAARAILDPLSLSETRGMDIISCPTCGRTKIDLISLLSEFERRAEEEGLDRKNIKVALMGCAVNGPGEARNADYGIAGGRGEGVIFRRGEVVEKVSEDRLVDRLEVKGIRVTDIEFTKQRTTSGVRYSAVLTLKFKKRQKHDNVLSEMSQFDGVYSVEEL